ncbi:hypothetical protein QZH41_006613 [Actinostola sp. cb2023]|nr:hypothetical protein QZH41_006613 [Actinostola sp. cb2023]
MALLFTKRRTPCYRLGMPGPWNFPVIGCMYLFRWSSSPYKILAWLAWIYGNVYCINLGETTVVVINSMETVKEVLYSKSRDFAGRPQLFSFSLWGSEETSFMLKDYSSDFLQLKYKAEISLQELLNKEESIACCRSLKAIKSLNESFESQGSQNSAFDPVKSIRAAVADFIMDSMFGPCISRWFYHEARFVLEQACSAYVKTAYVGACIDFVSVMRHLSRKTLNSTKFHVAQLRAFVRRVYQIHLRSSLQQSDYTQSLAFILRSHDKGYRSSVDRENSSLETRLEDETIVVLLTDIMFNAYEKISTCFEWEPTRIPEESMDKHAVVYM